MINKKISTMFLVILLAAFSVEAWAGPLVWGPKKYIRDTGPPVPITETFTIEKPKGKFWLQIGNGGHIKRPDIKRGAVEPVNQASSAYIKLNGVQVVGTNDLNQNIYGFTKDITLQANNIIEVEVRGKPESYITVEIRKAELNEMVGNKNYDLRGLNMKDQIVLWWSGDENAEEYVFYRAYSKDGPWIEWFRTFKGEPMNAVDGTPKEAQTMDLCYKIEALDSRGRVIRRYEPICVPKWQTEESAVSLTMESLSNTDVEPAIAGSTPASSTPYNDMCLSDNDFTNTSTMSYEDIKKFLKDKNSFLKGAEVEDVDRAFFDPTEFIDFAAQTYGINPQVILSTLQKESGAVRSPISLPVKDLKLIMGYGKPSTITDQILDGTAQMRRDFDRLSNGQPTAGGWRVGVAKLSGEPNPGDERDKFGNTISVTPANKAVAVLFSYTPWVGKDWGGGFSVREPRRAKIGGNALFCRVWKDYGFLKPVGCGASKIGYTTQQMSINQTQTLTVTYPQVGSTYSWEVTSGGGSVSPAIGNSTMYTAPGTNADCANNPTITLKAGTDVCDTSKIAVNAGAVSRAVIVNTETGNEYFPCCVYWILCDGTIDTPTPPEHPCEAGYSCSDPCSVCTGYEAGSTDIRTDAEKNAGCCPMQLLLS